MDRKVFSSHHQPLKMSFFTLLFIQSITSAPSSTVIPGQTYEAVLKAGKPLPNSSPLRMDTYLGTKEATHRTDSVNNVITSCTYEMGDFIRVDNTDKHIVGLPDSDKPFMWQNGLGCGTCFEVTHLKTGKKGVAIGGDFCAGCIAGGHDFDISDGLQLELGVPLSVNIPSSDLTWQPVECNWGGNPMRYVLDNGSNQFNWNLNIQGNTVPIIKLEASWDGGSTVSKGWGAVGGGSWPLDFMVDFRNNPGFKPVTLRMTGLNGKIIEDTIQFPSDAFAKAGVSVADKMAFPVVMGKTNF